MVPGCSAGGMTETSRPAPRQLAEIASYHAHVYFDGPEQRVLAGWIRERVAERFPVQLGGWHDRPVGPHHRPMYQIAFDVAVFPQLAPWLMINRQGLSVLVHPNTDSPYDDHLLHALWLGDRLALNGDVLPRNLKAGEELIDPVVVNTTPTMQA
jgi:aromatic ring-cleaving dioxygenase